MKKIIIQIATIILFILVSIVSLGMGIVPFHEAIPPIASEIITRIITFLIWLSVGIYACSITRRGAWLLLALPFSVMVLHCAGINYLITLPFSTVIEGDKYLFALMQFIFALLVQIGMIVYMIKQRKEKQV